MVSERESSSWNLEIEFVDGSESKDQVQNEEESANEHEKSAPHAAVALSAQLLYFGECRSEKSLAFVEVIILQKL